MSKLSEEEEARKKQEEEDRKARLKFIAEKKNDIYNFIQELKVLSKHYPHEPMYKTWIKINEEHYKNFTLH